MSQAKALDLYQRAEIKTAVEDLSWHVGFMRSLWEAVLVLRTTQIVYPWLWEPSYIFVSLSLFLLLVCTFGLNLYEVRKLCILYRTIHENPKL